MKRKTGPPKEKIKIEVTEEHIKAGLKATPDRCPIALSLQDRLKGVVTVYINTAYSWSGKYSSRAGFKLPPEVSSFIARFDETGEGEPFSFELEV